MPTPPLSVATIRVGTRIGGRYDLRDRIGAGAFGTVWEAYDRRLQRLVAIKLMPLGLSSDELAQENLQRFRVEAQAVARLSHAGIVTVHDFGEEADFAWFVMELIIGETLKAVLDRGERPSLTEVVRVITALLEALHHAHLRGIIHRDVKPANVLLAMGIEEGLGDVKLADFGIARVGDRNRTLSGQIIGTPAAMAPEQLRGEAADLRADIWAVGLLLYQLLTGRPAFGSGGFATLRSALNDAPPAPTAIRAGLPAVFDPIVAKALAKDPAARYANAREMAEALRTALRSVEASVATAVPEIPAALPLEQEAETVRLSAGTALIVVEPPELAPPPAPKRRWERLLLVGIGMALGVALAFGLGEPVQEAPGLATRPLPPTQDAAAEHAGPSASPGAAMHGTSRSREVMLLEPAAPPETAAPPGQASPLSVPAEPAPTPVERVERHEPLREVPQSVAVHHARPTVAPPAARFADHEPLREMPQSVATEHAAVAPDLPVERIEEHAVWREPHPPLAAHHAAVALPVLVPAPAPSVEPIAVHETLRESPEPVRTVHPIPPDAAAPAVLPAARPAEPEARSDLPAAAALPQCAADRMTVRAGSHPDYGRLVFDWRRPVRYDITPMPGGVRLRFRDAGCVPPVAQLALPRNIRALSADPVTGEITVETAPGTRVRPFRLDGRVILDVQDGG